MSEILLHDEIIQKHGMSPRDLTNFGMRYFNLNPVNKQLFVNEKIDCWPEGLRWKLDDQNNLLLHSWNIHPIYIWPENSSPYNSQIDDSFIIHACPNLDKWVMIQDSDEMIMLNCNTPPGRSYPKIPYDPQSLADWAKRGKHVNAGHCYVFERPLYIHSTDYRKAWEEVEKEANEFVLTVLSYIH